MFTYAETIPDQQAIIFRDEQDRDFICIAEQIAAFAQHGTEEILAVGWRAFQSNPALFRLLEHKVEIGNETPQVITAAGFTSDLTTADRRRLRQIVRKHHKMYFADHPTNRQVDQLIDSLGLEVAAKLVKGAVDGGHLG